MLETSHRPQQQITNEAMTESDFAGLGIHNVAYIRLLSPAAALLLFPELEDIPIEEKLYSLHAADGTPLLLARSYFDASETAKQNELTVHTLQ